MMKLPQSLYLAPCPPASLRMFNKYLVIKKSPSGIPIAIGIGIVNWETVFERA
jgi:hypothetical protein